MSRNVAIFAVLVLALAPRALAQVTAGEASLNLSGSVSAGYTDDYTNEFGSDHSIGGAGFADLSGFYYNPNFLSFDVRPFYDQSRLNSTYNSMTAASGVSAGAGIFGGSEFPGSVNYSTSFNNSGTFGVPGLGNYTTHGNDEVLSVNWGVHLPQWPRVEFRFSDLNDTYSLYGTSTEGTQHADLFSVTTSYKIAGFSLNGGYEYRTGKTYTPEFLAGELPERSDSDTSAFFLGVGHSLPWDGTFSASASRTDLAAKFGDTGYTGQENTAIDTLNAGIGFNPLPHLHLGADSYYTDNLEGTLYSTLLTAGVTLPENIAPESSHGLSFTGWAGYDMPAQHLNFYGFVERQQQTFSGLSLASNAVNGTATYSNMLLGGQLTGHVGLTYTDVSTSSQSLLGVISSASYAHEFRRWTLAGGFNYSQNTQTVLIAYTTSSYGYNGSVGRRLGRRSHWGAYASGGKSLLTNAPGSANLSQSYSTSLSLPRFSLAGGYSTSGGNGLLTSTGLTTTPIPVTVVPPYAVVFYRGRSYSLGLGSSPVRHLTLSASYSKALSSTTNNGTASNNGTENMNFLLLYALRKLTFNAGYSRLIQGFSASGMPPVLTGTFYVGVSRSFNFF